MYITISGKGSHRIVQLRDDRRVPGTDKRKAVIVKNYGNYEKLLAENMVPRRAVPSRAFTPASLLHSIRERLKS